MKTITYLLALAATFGLLSSAVFAQTGTLDVTAAYRERIALPPDARLDVQLLDVSRADAASLTIASQRVAMTSVPMTVRLHYDPAVIDAAGRYAVAAAIWSGDRLVFRTVNRFAVFDQPGDNSVEVMLFMVADDTGTDASPASIAGVSWSVTAVAGQRWSSEDPATLTIDEDMAFSIFGGCNRFVGQLRLSDPEIAFPDDFAGTLMACPEEVEALERRFLEALRGVSRYVRFGDGLVMTDADGQELRHFVAHPD